MLIGMLFSLPPVKKHIHNMNMVEKEPKGHDVRISTEKKMSHTSVKCTNSCTLPQTRTRNSVKTKQPEEKETWDSQLPGRGRLSDKPCSWRSDEET